MNGRRHPVRDWQQFQRDLLKQMPFIGGEKGEGGLGKFIQKAIKEYMPKTMPAASDFTAFLSGKAFDYELFESHRSVFVRFELPGGVSARQVRFFAGRRRLRVVLDGKAHDITLPSDVQSDRSVARLQNGIMEIRLPKSSRSEPLREIFIRDRT